MSKSGWIGFTCAVAGVVSTVTGLAGTSHAAEPGVQVVQDATAYERSAGGRAVVEDFTADAHYPLVGCRLDSETREQGLQAGDIEPGVVYSTPCSDPENFEFNIDAGWSFEGGYLDGFHHGERSEQRALRVSFTEPVRAFGFDTNANMGRSFKVRVIHTDGRVQLIDGLEVSAGYTSEQFYGFVSDAADIARVRIAGRGDRTFGFALDDFRFNPES